MKGKRGLRGPGWPGVGLGLTGLALGIGVGFLLGARRQPGGDRLEPSSVPRESWRGSGLAEDVGVPSHEGLPEPDAAERQRRMEEAREQLGLPNPDGWHARR